MTPLAMKIANQLTLPVKQRTFENERVLGLFSQDMHCFDITAIAEPIDKAMSEGNVWPDVSSMMPDLFLPSPVTWIEFAYQGRRMAYIIEHEEGWFRLAIATDGARPYAFDCAEYRSCTVLESPDRIKVELLPEPDFFSDEEPDTLPTPFMLQHDLAVQNVLRGDRKKVIPHEDQLRFARARHELLTYGLRAKERQVEQAEAYYDAAGMCNHAIGFSTLAIDLINTPGIVGMRQHAPHTGLAKKLARIGVGSYPLRAWSEVTVKTRTTVDDGEYESGATFRKCLHFVRAHRRHYRDGRESVVRAHWRGDPALGIKRTRYKVAA